jgi:hypothetical protein
VFEQLRVAFGVHVRGGGHVPPVHGPQAVPAALHSWVAPVHEPEPQPSSHTVFEQLRVAFGVHVEDGGGGAGHVPPVHGPQLVPAALHCWVAPVHSPEPHASSHTVFEQPRVVFGEQVGGGGGGAGHVPPVHGPQLVPAALHSWVAPVHEPEPQPSSHTVFEQPRVAFGVHVGGGGGGAGHVPPVHGPQLVPVALHCWVAPVHTPEPHASSHTVFEQLCVAFGVHVSADGHVPPVQAFQAVPLSLQVWVAPVQVPLPHASSHTVFEHACDAPGAQTSPSSPATPTQVAVTVLQTPVVFVAGS